MHGATQTVTCNKETSGIVTIHEAHITTNSVFSFFVDLSTPTIYSRVYSDAGLGFLLSSGVYVGVEVWVAASLRAP